MGEKNLAVISAELARMLDLSFKKIVPRVTLKGFATNHTNSQILD